MGCVPRVFQVLACLIAVLFAPPVRAADVPLVADLSEHLVAITTGFTGAEVLLFGATDGPGDVIIAVRGPSTEAVVRAKERIGPIWANTDAITFEGTPSFYQVASSKPLEEIARPDDLARLGIGSQNLALIPIETTRTEADVAAFKAALITLKQQGGLYENEPSSITQMANRLFRTRLYFPANVPVGVYQVTVYLYRDQELVSAEIVPLVISKTGIGAEIYDFAHNHSAIYGLLAIIIAVFAGWLASVAFRR